MGVVLGSTNRLSTSWISDFSNRPFGAEAQPEGRFLEAAWGLPRPWLHLHLAGPPSLGTRAQVCTYVYMHVIYAADAHKNNYPHLYVHVYKIRCVFVYMCTYATCTCMCPKEATGNLKSIARIPIFGSISTCSLSWLLCLRAWI